MKHVLALIFTLVALSLSLFSCSTPQYTITAAIDYSEFTKKGIFVTESNSVNFEYQPVGSVLSLSVGEVRNLLPYKVNINQTFQEMADELIKMNANGLINLRITSIPSNDLIARVSVTGMAIRTNQPIIDNKSLVQYKEPKTDIHIDGIHCFIIKQFGSGAAIMTEKKLSLEQIRKAAYEFNIKGKELQFFLPNTKDSYFGVTDNGFIINYETNEFIPLK